MGKPTKPWRELVFGPERARDIKSRLFLLLRDELGLGQQPKVARLLVDEITNLLSDHLTDAAFLQPGQITVLAPEIGQGPSWRHLRLEDKKMKTIVLTLFEPAEIEALASGRLHSEVRLERMVRMIQQAFEQGATITVCQLSILTGVSPAGISAQLRDYMKSHNTLLPLRGIIEDCSPAVTHKGQIIARHLEGESTSDIARATDHTPKSVERYIKRFEQVRELVRYLEKPPDAEILARILGCSAKLVETYLTLLQEHNAKVNGRS